MGREYLLEKLKAEVEEGKQTENTIVLYGTGGMGKTRLALEYIHQAIKSTHQSFRSMLLVTRLQYLGLFR